MPDRRQSLVSSLCVCVAGVALLLIAVPRVIAYEAVGRWSDIPLALDNGTLIERERLALAHESYTYALYWLPQDATLLLDRARIYRRQASLTTDGVEATRLRRAALLDLHEAAAAAPARSFVWAMLADAKMEMGASTSDVVEALRMSWFTGPQVASAILVRHRIVLRYWTEMPADLLSHALDDVALLVEFKRYRRGLVHLYLAGDYEMRAAMRERIARQEGSLELFDDLLLRVTGLRSGAGAP